LELRSTFRDGALQLRGAWMLVPVDDGEQPRAERHYELHDDPLARPEQHLVGTDREGFAGVELLRDRLRVLRRPVRGPVEARHELAVRPEAAPPPAAPGGQRDGGDLVRAPVRVEDLAVAPRERRQAPLIFLFGRALERSLGARRAGLRRRVEFALPQEVREDKLRKAHVLDVLAALPERAVHHALPCGVAIGPSGPPTAFDHMNCTGTFLLFAVSFTSFITRVRSGPASSNGMSPISPPRGEYQPRNRSASGVSPARIASSTSGSVRASQSSW